MFDVQQSGVPAHQGGGERIRLGEPAGHSERLVSELERLRRLGENEVLREPRQDAHRERAVVRSERGEDVVKEVGVGGIRGDGRIEAPPGAECGAREPVGRAELARQFKRPRERRARVGFARLPADRAERQQQVAARGGIITPDQRKQAEHAFVVLDGSLVGVSHLSRSPRLEAEHDGLVRAADSARLEIVMCQLGRVHGQRRISSASATRRCRRSRRLAMGRS